MKKHILTLLLPTLMASNAAMAAQLYQAEDGSVLNIYSRLGFNVTNKNDEHGDANGEFDGRIGLNGSQTINEHASVIGPIPSRCSRIRQPSERQAFSHSTLRLGWY